MNPVMYFLRTPSRYRRDAVIMCTLLLSLTLTPLFMVYGKYQPTTSAAAIARTANGMMPGNGSNGTPTVMPAVAAPAPTAGPIWPSRGVITAEFGGSGHPFTGTHSGIDIAGPANQPVMAFMPGTVVKAGALSYGCGKCVYIDHGNGVTSHYSHLSTIAASIGQRVNVGDVLGTQGNTGWSTGPHVHFEIQENGTPVNPRKYVPGNPAR